MKVVYASKDVEISKGLKARVEKKLSKLSRYFREEPEATIRFKVQKGARNITEITVNAGGVILRAEESSNDMYLSIDRAVDKLESQVRRYRTKLDKHLRDAKLEPIALPYRNEKPVVYYGSSITQGGCACRPGNAYQAMIGRKYNLDHINLGFSGSAKGEPEMAEHIASLEMEAFVCDYDHNAPSLEHLQNTLPEFYRIIREKHPDLPVIFVTKPDILLRPDWCKERRDYIFSVYEEAKAKGENVYFIPGEELFAGENWDDCTVDRCHPNDLGFFRMAQRIGAELKKALNL